MNRPLTPSGRALPTPEQKIVILEGSLRCFVLGLLGLIPVLGLGFAVGALRNGRQVRRAVTESWNPARRYLLWGQFLGAIGVLIAAGILTVVLLAVLENADAF